MNRKYKYLILFTSLTFTANLFCLSLEDKRKEILQRQKHFKPQDLSKQNSRIKELYSKLDSLYQNTTDELLASADETTFKSRHSQILSLRKEIEAEESAWKDAQEADFSASTDTFGIWEHGEITIDKLITHYGSCESLYVIPPEVANQKINLHCLLTIPKESWPKMIDVILTHNNIGVKKVNPFVKQLFILKDDFTNVDMISSSMDELKYFEQTSRIIFVYTPPIENIKTSFYFLDKFKNPKTTFVYQVGSKIAIVGLAREVNKLITLAENVWDREEKRVSRILSPEKISANDAVKLLQSYFGGLTDYSRPMISTKGGNNLSAFTLKGENSLVLIGPQEIVDQGETLIRRTESQISNPNELTLYTYTCCHAKPDELADILSQIYSSLVSIEEQVILPPEAPNGAPGTTSDNSNPYLYEHLPAYYQTPQQLIHNFEKLKKEVTPKPAPKEPDYKNFFPFATSNTLLMVVRQDTLPKIKEVLKKLDTPKKMIELEVLLCERLIKSEAKAGINLLKLGDAASNTDDTSFTYQGAGLSKGFMDFIFNRKRDPKRNLPALDFTYKFLLSQDDVVVTASPSTTTLNQIATTISITDQISINQGANKNDAIIYTREDIGTTVTITPTIHEPHCDDSYGTTYLTLVNEIQFDSFNSDKNDQPDVHRRHISNTVRIPDGQTVIIGGLRATQTEDSNQKIPFLGEIPGFAKIFGTSAIMKKNSEMFIFIKPKVLNDPATELLRIRERKLKRRPGDTDMMLEKLNESRKNDEQRRFAESFNLFFSSGNKYDQTLRPQ